MSGVLAGVFDDEEEASLSFVWGEFIFTLSFLHTVFEHVTEHGLVCGLIHENSPSPICKHNFNQRTYSATPAAPPARSYPLMDPNTPFPSASATVA